MTQNRCGVPLAFQVSGGSIRPSMMMDEKVLGQLRDTYEMLQQAERLVSESVIEQWVDKFRRRFSPDALAQLDGPDLLYLMHGGLRSANERTERDDLIFWLTRKRLGQITSADFGTLPNGTAAINAPYFHLNRQCWMARAGGRNFMPVNEEDAIEVARRERNYFTAAARCLTDFPTEASMDEYLELQKRLDTVSTSFTNSPWVHKYLSLLFPDTLDFFHGPELQRFHLTKMLCPLPIGSGRMRYAVAGLFRMVQKEAGIDRMQHFTAVLAARNGSKPCSYLVLDLTGEGVPHWHDLVDHGCLALDARAVAKGGALTRLPTNTLTRVGSSSDRLRARQDLNGYWGLGMYRAIDLPFTDGDVVVAVKGGEALGVGRVTGPISVLGSTEYSLRMAVEWHVQDPWRVPHEHLLRLPTVSVGSRTLSPNYENIVEIERHLLHDPILFPSTTDRTLSDRDFPPKRLGIMTTKSGHEEVDDSAVAIESPTLPELTGVVDRVARILGRKGQVILFGPPGTGKSHWAERTAVELAARSWFGKEWALLSETERNALVSPKGHEIIYSCCFHPAYGYEDFFFFLEGYRPNVSKSQESGLYFERRDGVFKRLCAAASARPERDFFLLIDEINRGDVPRIFGELLAVMEKGKRGKTVLLPLSGEPFAVPKNVYIIGTMNTADRSIALLDAALRRRFGFIELLPDPSLLASSPIGVLSLANWLEELNQRIVRLLGPDGRHLQVGHAYFLDSTGRPINDISSLAQVLRDDVIPLLEEYCYEDLSLLGELLGSDLINQNGRVRDELFTDGHEAELLYALANGQGLTGNFVLPVSEIADGDFDSYDSSEEPSV